jgi:hypothetical protein
MDNFHPQSAGGHVKEGHDDRDLSVRAIIISGIALGAAGVAAFLLVLGFYWGLQKWDKEHQPAMTTMENQLRDEREPMAETAARTPVPEGQEEGVKPAPDWYGRGKMEEHLDRTFPDPRLQYDDEYDMTLFRSSEDKWLSSTGKDPDGTVHIPVDQAMQLLVQRGLPQVSGPFAPNNLPTAVPMVPAGPSKR